jgi:homogentisate 1,2-dioxygenase
MFESSVIFTLTDYAMKTPKRHGAFSDSAFCYAHLPFSLEHEPKMWDNLKGQFMNHLDEVNAELRKAGLKELGKS